MRAYGLQNRFPSVMPQGTLLKILRLLHETNSKQKTECNKVIQCRIKYFLFRKHKNNKR